MIIEKFADGTHSTPRLTIAQSIRRCSNPILAAVTSFSKRDVLPSEDHLHDKKVFHFEDGSFLTFEVSYMAIEDGESV